MLFILPLSHGGVTQTSALFSAAKKAEAFPILVPLEDDRNRISKAGFYMLCALGTADVSRVCMRKYFC